MIFYFTGTGNSLYAAKELDEKIISIPQVIKREKLGHFLQILAIAPSLCLMEGLNDDGEYFDLFLYFQLFHLFPDNLNF